jgi:flagellar protein FlgJ
MDVHTYTDIQGLNHIKRQNKSNPDLAKKEVSKQFESLMLQMLLKSMRDGTRAISEDSNDDDHKEIYEDLFDKQLAMSMSDSGVGLADLIEKSLTQAEVINQVDASKTIDKTDNKKNELHEISEPKKLWRLTGEKIFYLM